MNIADHTLRIYLVFQLSNFVISHFPASGRGRRPRPPRRGRAPRCRGRRTRPRPVRLHPRRQTRTRACGSGAWARRSIDPFGMRKINTVSTGVEWWSGVAPFYQRARRATVVHGSHLSYSSWRESYFLRNKMNTCTLEHMSLTPLSLS